MLHGFGLRFAHMSSTLVAPKLVQCVLLLCNRGLEHGRPAQRTMSKVIIDGFP